MKIGDPVVIDGETYFVEKLFDIDGDETEGTLEAISFVASGLTGYAAGKISDFVLEKRQ